MNLKLPPLFHVGEQRNDDADAVLGFLAATVQLLTVMRSWSVPFVIVFFFFLSMTNLTFSCHGFGSGLEGWFAIWFGGGGDAEEGCLLLI